MRLALALFCCAFLPAPALAETDESLEPIELVVWGLGEGESQIGRVAAMDEFERRWNADSSRPPLKIVKSVQGGRMNPQRLMTAIAGGAPPDVVNQDRFSIGGWASRGAFLPLNPFMEADDKTDPLSVRREDYFKACWEEAVYEGNVYAVPNSSDARVLFYNMDLLEAAGYVDEQGRAKPPKTWAELKEYAVRLTVEDADGSYERIGFIPNYGNSWLYLYGWQNEGRFMSADGETCTLDDPRIVEALEYMKEVYEALGGRAAVESFISVFQAGALDPFLNGKVAMKIDTNGFMGTVARWRPDLRFGVAPAPRPEAYADEPLTWSGGFSWAIPRGAKHPDAAWQFIRWMSGVEAAKIENLALQRYNKARGRLYVPGISANARVNEWTLGNIVENSRELELHGFAEHYKTCVRLMRYSRFRPVTPVGQLLWDEHRRAFDRATLSPRQFTPQKALEIGANETQRELIRLKQSRERNPMYWTIAVPLLLLAVGIGAALVFARGHAARQQALRPDAKREAFAGYLFASPWIFGFLLLTVGPVSASILLSFTEYDALNPAKFAGLDNYVYLTTKDPVFWKSLGNTAYMALAVPLGMAVGLALAMLLSAETRGSAAYRTFFYLPAVVPVVASSILWVWVLNPNSGLLNTALQFVGLDGMAESAARRFGADGLFWLQEESLAKPAIVLMGLWSAGSSMVIWLAGLKSVPKQLYEAAEIDGAGRIARFIRITLPMLTPYIFFNLVMGIIGAFQIFTQAYVMTEGGPADSTLFYVYYLFNNAFRYFRMGYASAMAWILFGIILILTLIQFKLAPRWVHYGSSDSS